MWSYRYSLRAIIIIGVTITSCMQSEKQPQEKCNTLSVMSWNIYYGFDKQQVAWPTRIKLIQNTILQHHPTIIGIQEGNRCKLAEMMQDKSSNLNEEYSIFVGQDDVDGTAFNPNTLDLSTEWEICNKQPYPKYRHNAILYNPNIFAPISNWNGTFWLSSTPNIIGSTADGVTEPRIATWMLFEIVNNPHLKLLFVSTHLEAKDDGESQRRNQLTHLNDQVYRIVNEYQKLIEGDGDLMLETKLIIIITGDFNENNDSDLHNDAINRIFRWNENGMKDCVVNAGSMEPGYSWHNWKGLSYREKVGRKISERWKIIDWILCSDNMVNGVVNGRILSNVNVNASDHFPIIIEWEMQ